MTSYDAESKLSTDPTVVLYSEFSIEKARFQLTFAKENNAVLVSGAWVNVDHMFKLSDLTDYFEIELPDFLDVEFVIDMVKLKYCANKETSHLEFDIAIKDFGKLDLSTTKQTNDKQRSYDLNMDFNQKLELKNLPIIGTFCDDGDGFLFKKLGVNYKSGDKPVFSFSSDLIIKHNSSPLNLDYAKSLQSKLSTSLDDAADSLVDRESNHSTISSSSFETPALSEASQNTDSKNKIHWIDMNKGFSVLYFSKIGASLEGSQLTLYLDASFTIAMLRIDFYELYVSTSLKNLKDIQFGLSGLMVSMEQPSFSISGGLYKSQADELIYNGALSLQIGSYGFKALGSYGEMPGSGEQTFFAYLMMSLPLGGPPFFYVTGLALGFGVNRSIRLPGIDGVRDFPFVAAAMGTSAKLKSDTPPNIALDALSETIVPDPGQYFLSAGIRFLTFGVLESFALLNIEMGNRLVISMLGLSRASVPPNVKDKSPIMQAELALKMVFDPEQGEFMMVAALTDRSFLLDPACRLTGGFAVGFWFKGTYSGDFIVTLGGCHHPDFQNVHYPVVAPLGLSWVVNDQISIKGEAYFAMTPNCMMAGIRAKLLFESGDLKAWLFVSADFILKWKPFFYRASVQVSVGVSYRVSIWGIGKTFNIEMGAGLELWGPEFSGNVRINWSILSFTIGFGSGQKVPPTRLEWNEFVDSFLPDTQSASDVSRSTGEATRFKLNTIQVTGGLIDEYKDQQGQKAYVLDGYNAAFAIAYKTPCTDLQLNGKTLLNNEVKIGIVPMELPRIQMKQQVTIINRMDGKSVESFVGMAVLDNVPAALWSTEEPKLSDSLIRGIPVGMTMNIAKSTQHHILPSENGAYEDTLFHETERLIRQAIYRTPQMIDKMNYPRDEQSIIERFQTTIHDQPVRDAVLAEIAATFGTWDQQHIETLASHPKAVWFAAPELRTIGAM